MRVSLIGQAAFGEAVFRALADAGEQIVAVSSITGTAERPDPLWAAAGAAAIARFPTGSLKKPDVLEAYGATRPELCVMAFVTHILPERVLTAPTLGTIQYHPSLLPRHRGISSMHWTIRRGETKTGLTVFWVDAGIDTGPILLQAEVDIGPDDTVGLLYFDKLFKPGVDALVEAVGLVREGKAPRITQDESQATYEPPADDGNSAIDWMRPAGEVYNLIRGSNPAPGAHTVLYATPIRIFDARLTLLEDPHAVPGDVTTPAGVKPAGPGSILTSEDNRIDIALIGGTLHVHRAQRIGGKKLPAKEFAAEMGIEVGDAFENGASP
ncbi:MAG: methionyl-tRNA formyltransferase [Chloroflexota bacterium]|nr:methionyl-tRNA formyltransferase [Chloroflexota bacterium]